MKEFDIEKVKQNWEKAQKGELVCTRDSRPVRLLCLNAKGDYPLVGVIDKKDYETPECWNTNGKVVRGIEPHDSDLKLQTTKIKGWVNVYEQGNGQKTLGSIWESKEKAESMPGAGNNNYVRTMYIEYEE